MERNSKLCTENMTHIIHKIASNAHTICEAYEKIPKTFIHNDLSPRNCCLRRSPVRHQRSLCLYDWEFACIHVPQADVVHFLAFVLCEEDVFRTVSMYAELYHRLLLMELQLSGCKEETLQMVNDMESFQKVFDYSMMEFMAYRVMMYQSFSHSLTLTYPFLPRIGNVALAYGNAIAHRYPFLSE